MDSSRHKEIMAYAETQFAVQWAAIRNDFNSKLREAQFRARRTNNSAAILPAEASCYIDNAKAIVVAKAYCIGEAYTAFNEPAGHEADSELSTFFITIVAGRKSSFQFEAELRSMRIKSSNGQLTGLLHSFERETNVALVEGRAILNKQRIAMINRLQAPAAVTKYVVDTCVFNWLVDGVISKEALPSDGGFAITHIQVDEINKTKDEERRAKLVLMQTSLPCALLPTQTFRVDISRWGHAKFGDGKLCMLIEGELNRLNSNKKNNNRDALIAEVAIYNGYTLITADSDLRSATEIHGGNVIFFPPRPPIAISEYS